MSELNTEITEDTTVTTDDAATSAVDPPIGQEKPVEQANSEAPDYKKMYEEQSVQFEQFRKQFDEIKDFVGFSEVVDETEDDNPDTKPTSKEQELAGQVESMRAVMQEHVDAAVESLTEDKQALIKELGGDDPMAQFRALTKLQKAGVLTTSPKPKNERGSHQRRADTSPQSAPPKTRAEFREQLHREMQKQGLL